MIFSRRRFTRTFAEPLAAPAAHEAAVIEEELQQAQPGLATVEMAPQRQAVAQPRLEVFNEGAAAWRALHGLGDCGPDPVELMAHGGMQQVPALPEGARGVGLAMQQTGLADQIVRYRRRARDGGQLVIEHAAEGEQVVALILQGDAHRADV
jgi:hypothetical protein